MHSGDNKNGNRKKPSSNNLSDPILEDVADKTTPAKPKAKTKNGPNNVLNDAVQSEDTSNIRKLGTQSHMIGEALKTVYQRTLEEEIPDDFADLLKQLK